MAFTPVDNGESSGIKRPVFVAGRSHRWIGLIMEKGKLVIYINNREYEYPTDLIISENEEHILVVSVDLEQSIIQYSLDGMVAETLNLPSGFVWNFNLDYLNNELSYGNLCAQDYSNGTAFKGSYNWILAASGILSVEEVKYIIENGPEIPSYSKESDLLISAYNQQSYSAQADIFTIDSGLRNTLDTISSTASYRSPYFSYHNYTPASGSLNTISVSQPLFSGNTEGHLYINDPNADNWQLSSYRIYLETAGVSSIKLELFDGGNMIKLGEENRSFDSAFTGYITLSPDTDRIDAGNSIYVRWTQVGTTGVRATISGDNSSTFPIGHGDGILQPYDLAAGGESREICSWSNIYERELIIDLDIAAIPDSLNLYLEGETAGITYTLTDGTNTTGSLIPGTDEPVNLLQPTQMTIVFPDGIETEIGSYVLMWK